MAQNVLPSVTLGMVQSDGELVMIDGTRLHYEQPDDVPGLQCLAKDTGLITPERIVELCDGFECIDQLDLHPYRMCHQIWKVDFVQNPSYDEQIYCRLTGKDKFSRYLGQHGFSIALPGAHVPDPRRWFLEFDHIPSPPTSHSSNLDQRRRPETFFAAMATALRWPTRTTNFLPRVIPV